MLNVVQVFLKDQFYDVSTIFRWQKCVSVASSDNKGFGMAAGHAYIKKMFDEDSRKIVGSYFLSFLYRSKSWNLIVFLDFEIITFIQNILGRRNG